MASTTDVIGTTRPVETIPVGWLSDLHRAALKTIVCPRGHANDGINIVCAEPVETGAAGDTCGEGLVRWPDWFTKTFNRLVYVNLLRLGAVAIALGIGL